MFYAAIEALLFLKRAVSPNLVLLKNPIKVLVLIGNPLVVASNLAKLHRASHQSYLQLLWLCTSRKDVA